MLMRILLTFAIALFLPLIAYASEGPFGFDLKKDPKEYYYCNPTESYDARFKHDYLCETAPKPHPIFERYRIRFLPGVGVIHIRTSKLVYGPNPLGILLRDLREVQGQLKKRYGEAGKISNSPHGGSKYVWDSVDGTSKISLSIDSENRLFLEFIILPAEEYTPQASQEFEF